MLLLHTLDKLKWSFYPSALCEQNTVHLTWVGSSVTRQSQLKSSSREWSSHWRDRDLQNVMHQRCILGKVTHPYILISKPYYFFGNCVILTKIKNLQSLLCCVRRPRHGETKIFLSVQAWRKINPFPEFPKQPCCLTPGWQ